MVDEVKPRRQMFDGFKSFMAFLLSELGILVLFIVYAVVGARMFISLELPLEEERRNQMKLLGEDIQNRQNFITEAAWAYIKYERFNMSAEQFSLKMDETLMKQVEFILEAAGNGYQGYKQIDSW